MPNRRLQVLYNTSPVPQRRSRAGVYPLELGRALDTRPTVELTVLSPRDTGFGRQVRTPAQTARRIAWEEFALGRIGALDGADVYHGPHFFVPRTARPSVATVHDLTFFRIPRRYGRAHRLYYERLARAATRAGRIIVPSAAVAGDCVRYLGYPPERIRVIAEAPRAGLGPATEAEVADWRRRHAIEGPYFACLGTAEPGKRAVDAIRAMPAILGGWPGARLAIAGNPGPLSKALEREVQRLGLGGSVRFLGYLPDEDLAAFLSGAVALIFPSLYEGFGLPPLEALACGAPVITSDAPAMNAVLVAGALFVPPRDPGAIALSALSLAEGGRRADLAAAGRASAATFSWERAAEETESVYREVAS